MVECFAEKLALPYNKPSHFFGNRNVRVFNTFKNLVSCDLTTSLVLNKWALAYNYCVNVEIWNAFFSKSELQSKHFPSLNLHLHNNSLH